jgi:hypothetical protein
MRLLFKARVIAIFRHCEERFMRRGNPEIKHGLPRSQKAWARNDGR